MAWRQLTGGRVSIPLLGGEEDSDKAGGRENGKEGILSGDPMFKTA